MVQRRGGTQSPQFIAPVHGGNPVHVGSAPMQVAYFDYAIKAAHAPAVLFSFSIFTRAKSLSHDWEGA